MKKTVTLLGCKNIFPILGDFTFPLSLGHMTTESSCQVWIVNIMKDITQPDKSLSRNIENDERNRNRDTQEKIRPGAVNL